MALFFLDTSALIKKYVAETGSAWVQQLISGNPIAISAFALVEVASALGRQTRVIVQNSGVGAGFPGPYPQE